MMNAYLIFSLRFILNSSIVLLPQLHRCIEASFLVWTKMACGPNNGHDQMEPRFNYSSNYRGIHLWQTTGFEKFLSDVNT